MVFRVFFVSKAYKAWCSWEIPYFWNGLLKAVGGFHYVSSPAAATALRLWPLRAVPLLSTPGCSPWAVLEPSQSKRDARHWSSLVCLKGLRDSLQRAADAAGSMRCWPRAHPEMRHSESFGRLWKASNLDVLPTEKPSCFYCWWTPEMAPAGQSLQPAGLAAPCRSRRIFSFHSIRPLLVIKIRPAAQKWMRFLCQRFSPLLFW